MMFTYKMWHFRSVIASRCYINDRWFVILALSINSVKQAKRTRDGLHFKLNLNLLNYYSFPRLNNAKIPFNYLENRMTCGNSAGLLCDWFFFTSFAQNTFSHNKHLNSYGLDTLKNITYADFMYNAPLFLSHVNQKWHVDKFYFNSSI
jgi:hypothetical protein